MATKSKDVRTDCVTSGRLRSHVVTRKANRYHAKIYGRTALFILQKYGRQFMVAPKESESLNAFGKRLVILILSVLDFFSA
jgi:hypothetical protein